MIKKIINVYRRNFWKPERYAKLMGVKIGDNCDIQINNFGSEPFLIEIGNHVQITAGTSIFTHGASWVLRDENPDADVFGRVKIGNNVYIGNRAMIMPGVTIGSNVIVAAGSVVTKSVSDFSIVGGNPAKQIGNLKDFKERMDLYDVKSKKMNRQEKKKFLLSLSEDKFLKK